MEKALSPQVRCLVRVGIERRLASDEQRLREEVWWWIRSMRAWLLRTLCVSKRILIKSIFVLIVKPFLQICLSRLACSNTHIFTKVWVNPLIVLSQSSHTTLSALQVLPMVCRCQSVCHLVLIIIHFNFHDLRPHIELTQAKGFIFRDPRQLASDCSQVRSSVLRECQANTCGALVSRVGSERIYYHKLQLAQLEAVTIMSNHICYFHTL